VQNPTNRPVSEETKQLIDKLLLERLSIAAISRVTGVSETWIQRYVNYKSRTVEKKVAVSAKKRGLSRFNVMKYGHLWGRSKSSNGFGWQWI